MSALRLCLQSLRIEKRSVIVGGSLKEPLVFKSTKHVDGVEFFHAHKKDSALLRLLYGVSWSTSRPGKDCTDVIGRLTAMRNTAVAKLMNPQAEVDLGLDDIVDQPAKRMRVTDIDLPKTVTITAPSAGELESLDVRVVTGSGSDKLYIELTKEVLTWLQVATMDDNFGKAAGDNLEPDSKLPKNITYDRNRKAYKVRWKTTSKWFPSCKSEDALGDATRFLETVQKTQGSDTGDPPQS